MADWIINNIHQHAPSPSKLTSSVKAYRETESKKLEKEIPYKKKSKVAMTSCTYIRQNGV